MKKLIIALAFMASAVVAMAQGTVTFQNRVVADGVDAPIYNIDGTTLLSGSGFMAQLYYGAAGAAESALTPAGAAVIFRTGTRAGYVDNTDETRTLSGIAGGAQAALQVRAWDASKGATYEAALLAGGAVGKSAIITIATGGAGAPPSLPTSLVGLSTFKLVSNVPEPTAIALGLLGAGALFLRRRK